MSTFIRCGQLFTGAGTDAAADQVLVVGDKGTVLYAGPAQGAPAAGPNDAWIDHSSRFVLPGLIDVHTHLAFGNAKSEEDIDLYSPLEFRALRGLFFAQKVLAAGYTSLCSPGDAGQISLSVRDAVKAGLFTGPRVTAAGPFITSPQGLTDWYPSWIGAPETSVGRLVSSRDEAIAEIRRQVKNGVDVIKIDLDGRLRNAKGELIASFTQEETTAMVEEAHRLDRKAIVHAFGREGTLYAARAGADLIFHAHQVDDACIEALLKNGCVVGPTLTFQLNTIEFSQPFEPAYTKRVPPWRRIFEEACVNLSRARAAGVPMVTGTDSGFAVTPYGEWHARELEIFVRHLGFTPAEALRASTAVPARLLAGPQRVGVLEAGRAADFVVVNGSPLEDITILQDRARLHAVYLGGRRVELPDIDYDPRAVSDFSWYSWTDLYTRDRVAALRRTQALAAE